MPSQSDEDYKYCLNFVRDFARDTYLADLLLPPEIRSDTVALHAFDVEIANAVTAAKEPLAGEMRLQWWTEVIEEKRSDEALGHPVARALLQTISRSNLPRSTFIAKLEAHIFDLYNDPMGDRTMYEGYLGETRSAIFQLAAIIAGGRIEADLASASGHCGVVVGVVHHLQNLAASRQRGQVYLPSDLLASVDLSVAEFLAEPDERHSNAVSGLVALGQEHLFKAQSTVSKLSEKNRMVFKPLLVCSLYLAQSERNPERLLHGPVAISQIKKQWALWRG